MSELGSAEFPLRVAVVGSGPSGFYVAEALQKSALHVQIEMFDRLPTPFGLVRLGVAPDHEKIKTATRVYERIASDPSYAFFGNVMVGRDVTIEELRAFYDAIVMACGAETDRRLNIPGEDLHGSHTATEFVAWYNGHPDYRDRQFDLDQSQVVVVGQGNVAVDVCRILAKTADELKHTDIAQHALEQLATSQVRDIYMIGRRGPVQAKFTQLEVKELGQLPNCDAVVDTADLDLDPLSRKELDDPESKTARKIVPILEQISKRSPSSKNRRLFFRFLESPIELRGGDRVTSVVLEKNTLTGDPGSLKARGTGKTFELPCGLVFRSVGYHGLPVPGLPFEVASGTIPNERGRITENGRALQGAYAVGWIKRGPSGVIGTNKPDAVETVDALLADVASLKPCAQRNSDELMTLLSGRAIRVVTYPDWRRIDAVEVKNGQRTGKPREKLTRIQEMMEVLDAGPDSADSTASLRENG